MMIFTESDLLYASIVILWLVSTLVLLKLISQYVKENYTLSKANQELEHKYIQSMLNSVSSNKGKNYNEEI